MRGYVLAAMLLGCTWGQSAQLAPKSALAFPAPLPVYTDFSDTLSPGMYIYGQLWRWDGTRWTEELPPATEPLVSVFEVEGLGVVAVTWDAVFRRVGGSWQREQHHPTGRPRLSAGWGP